MEKKEKEVTEEYLSSLADLTLNSKPLINMLTILAEENIEHGPVIVKAVEQHITKVNPDVKLPVLYLIDSIVKNVGREYIQLFSHSIVNIFCGVFEKVNEKIREKMYTLRQTWNDVFTPQKLYTLDVKVNCMDPNWPITAKVVPKSPAIHVNPNFLKAKGEPINEMHAKLRDKQRELLELEKRKLELELEATKQRLKEQEKRLTMQTDSVKAVMIPPSVGPPTGNIHMRPPHFNQFKVHPQRMNAPGNMLMGFNYSGGNPSGKPRVAPVNPSMLNTLRHRDPRLARQQQHQQASTAMESANPENATSTGPPQGPNPRSPINTMQSMANNASEKMMTGKSNHMRQQILTGGDNKSRPANYNVSHKQNRSGNLQSKPNSQSSGGGKGNMSNRTGSRSPTRSSSSSSRNKGSSSSSSRSSSSNKTNNNSTGLKSYDKKPKESKSSSNDRKKLNKTESPTSSTTLSPTKQSKLSKSAEKSPKRGLVTDSSKTNPSPPGTTEMTFKDLKPGTKFRNYMRRNRDKSPSPTSLQDVDLRIVTPDKKMKVDDDLKDQSNETQQPENQKTPSLSQAQKLELVQPKQSTTESQEQQLISISTPAVAPTSSPEKLKQEIKPLNLVQNLETASCKDVDLRHFQANPTNEATIDPVIKSSPEKPREDTKPTPMEVETETKRRSSSDKSEEPLPKRSKSEKLDELFGTEDVDLRTLPAVSAVMAASAPIPGSPPPPPIISKESRSWATVKQAPKNSQTSPQKTSLDDVRAKLAKAAKNSSKLGKGKLLNRKSRFTDANEDSGDATDANIRTIISQAQELLDNENMNADQYNSLVKTVIQINETNKLKEAQRLESLLNNKSNNTLQDLTPISDEEVKFSSEEEVDFDKARKIKLVGKALAQGQGSNPKDGKSSDVGHGKPMPINNRRNSPTSQSFLDTLNQKPPKEKRVRQKESKWSPWDQNMSLVGVNNPSSNQNGSWGPPPNRPMFPHKNHAVSQSMGGHTNLPRLPIPNPWQNPPPMLFASGPLAPPPPMPPPSLVLNAEPNMPPILLAQNLSNSVDNPNSDVLRTINIDNVPKEIRFYDETAIAFMEWDQPKEIGFQAGQRRIIVDDKEAFTLNFNDDYKTVSIEGKSHQIRFGCPTRELYIDNNWYECYFGDPPVGIYLNGRIRVFKIDQPPPQVRIGNLRQDLVVGKINFIVDARIIVPVFLDSKIQTFEVDGHKHTLQFADNLCTVLIDNDPIEVEYGGLPKSYLLGGVKHFIRFGTLPIGVAPGRLSIKNMLKTSNFKSNDSPPRSPTAVESNAATQSKPQSPATSPISGQRVETQSTTVPNERDSVQNTSTGSASTNVSATTTAPSQSTQLPAINSLNIDELFQKLLASGILNKTGNESAANDDNNAKKSKERETVRPIDLNKSETIKTKQIGIVQTLYCGMQCSSCGVRFPPEQTMKYSQHLDWHFRQNRRDRDSARKAHSRKWYYEVSDWIQYEEIEDLEDREKNWFETQQNELDHTEEASNQRLSSPPPSCPAGPDDLDKVCDMCHDQFEQFYNEETEEWHLRSAIRLDDKIYHPLCYEDYKASLTLDETQLETSVDDNAVDEIIVKTERSETGDDKDDVIIEDDDDDVIVVPMDEPSITEIPDDEDEDVRITESSPSLINKGNTDNQTLDIDDDSQKKPENGTEEQQNRKNNESMESDVEIQEPVIPFTDLDTYEETPEQILAAMEDSSQSSHVNNMKIKEEPKDDGYDDDAFEDVGTFVSIEDLSENIDEYVPQSVAPSHDSNLVASMDGNVDPQEASAATSVGTNKIKINITKNVNQNRQIANTNINETTVGMMIARVISGEVVDSNINANTNNKQLMGTDDNSCKTNKSNLSSVPIDTSYLNDINSAASPKEDSDLNIEFNFKPELQGVELKTIPKMKSGYETSGLCSIM